MKEATNGPSTQREQQNGKKEATVSGIHEQQQKISITKDDKRGEQPGYEIADIMGGLYGDGFIALKGAFPRDWVLQLNDDVVKLYEEALKRPGGAVGRGPKRHYVEIHPEDIHGFVELATHPWVVAVCEAILGPDYKIVEIGFDVPNPGAVAQPWHRDFAAPDDTLI